jgi:hypothetical protein
MTAYGARRIWLLLSSLGLIAAGPRPVTNVQREGPSNKAETEIVKSMAAISSTLKEAKGSAVAERSNCARGIYDEQSDLCAQWKAANAAERGADAAKWSVVIGWVGVLLGLVTMGAAIAAAIFAKRAADANRAANKLFQKHVSAKLETENFVFKMPAQAPPNGPWLAQLSFQVDNLGDTAAHKAKFIVTAYLLDRRRPMNRMRASAYAGAVRLGLKSDVEVVLKIKPEDLAEISRDRVNRVLLHVDGSFDNVFGERVRGDRWLLGVTRRKGVVGSDHHADDFRSVDADFINRLNAGVERKAQNRQGLRSTASLPSG